jgi:hypothetical protein
MPAVSRKQQIAMAIAEHDPDKLSNENRGLLKMSHQQLHDFAATPRKGLPESANDDDGDEPKPPRMKPFHRIPKGK